MDYTKTKKAFRQIEEWRKETGELEQKHINNITDKDILLYLAKKQSEQLNAEQEAYNIGYNDGAQATANDILG